MVFAMVKRTVIFPLVFMALVASNAGKAVLSLEAKNHKGVLRVISCLN